MYMGHEGLNTDILNNDKTPHCSICHLPKVVEADPNITLEKFIEE